LKKGETKEIHPQYTRRRNSLACSPKERKVRAENEEKENLGKEKAMWLFCPTAPKRGPEEKQGNTS